MFTGPLQIDTAAHNAQGSFWYNAPIFFNKGTDRFCMIQNTIGATWNLKFYKLVAGVWTLVATGPSCMKPNGVPGLQTTQSCPTGIVDPLDANIFIAAYVEPTASNLSIASFNMTTFAVNVISSTGPVVHGVDLVFIASVFSDDTGSKACISYRPSDNKFVFSFQGAPEVVVNNCLRPNFVTYDRTLNSWSAPVIIAVAGENLPYVSYGIVTDPATSISYAAIMKPNGGTGATTNEIWYVQIDADNTIHAKVQVALDVRRDREMYGSYPVLQKIGGQTIFNIAYVDNAGSGFFKARIGRAVVGVAPVFTIEDISTTSNNSPVNNNGPFMTPSLAVGDNNKLYAFWQVEPSPAFADSIFMSTTLGIGSGWAVPAMVYASNPASDFLSRPTISNLGGINPGGATIAIGMMDSQVAPLPESNLYFEFSEAGAPAAFGGPFYLNAPQPFQLPDPRIFCDRAQMKRCIVFQGEELMYQGSKGVFYVTRQQQT